MALFPDADAIVILGGGDEARWRQGLVLAANYPDAPLVVTGDSGAIASGLISHGLPARRILIEQAATSTAENAQFTRPILDEIHARRVILVTNWYHVPRTLRTFRKYQPGREFVVSFEPKADPLTNYDLAMQFRERLATIYNLLVRGVWCF